MGLRVRASGMAAGHWAGCVWTGGRCRRSPGTPGLRVRGRAISPQSWASDTQGWVLGCFMGTPFKPGAGEVRLCVDFGVLRPGRSPTPRGHQFPTASRKVTTQRSQSQGHGLGERFSCLSVPSPALVTPELGGRPLSRRSSGVGTTASPLGPEMRAQMTVDAQLRS